MTVGQRIAQKRKERNLTQEALGNEMGVTRQAIYKWESDAALPDIDKLIALSRLFGVPVGWLLGVEEQPEAPEPSDDRSGELTETQVKMVQEITERYLAAQPKPKRKIWPWVLCAVVGLVVFCNLFARLNNLNNQYNNLQNSIFRIDQNVSWQINGISDRVEEILKSQNNLTADYGTEIVEKDLAENTIRISVRAVPKNSVEGMTAMFLVDSGSGPEETAARLEAGHTFTGEIITALTDNITVSVEFRLPDGTAQTQLLDTYTYEYTETLPDSLVLDDFALDASEAREGSIVIDENNRYVLLRDMGQVEVELADVQVALFRNGELLCWAEPCEIPSNYQGYDELKDHFFRLPEMTIPADQNMELQAIALITDSYGRSFVLPGWAYCLDPDGGVLRWSDEMDMSIQKPEDWGL